MPRSVGLVVLFFAAACGSFAEKSEKSETDERKPEPPAKHEDPVLQPAPTNPTPVESTPASQPAKPACAVGFTKELLPLLDSSCASTVCHGDVNDPRIDATQPKPTYDALTAKSFGSIEWNDPHPDFADQYDPGLKDTLATWRLCGAPFE